MPRRPKLSKSEQVDRDLRRWQRAQERALIMERKAANLLKRSAVELARLHKKRAKLDREVPSSTVDHSTVTPTAADGRPAKDDTVPLAQLGETEIGKANRESWNAANPILAKPKRKPKPKAEAPVEKKAGDPGPQLLAEMLPRFGGERDARMKAMGFRKTSNRRKPANVEPSGS